MQRLYFRTSKSWWSSNTNLRHFRIVGESALTRAFFFQESRPTLGYIYALFLFETRSQSKDGIPDWLIIIIHKVYKSVLQWQSSRGSSPIRMGVCLIQKCVQAVICGLLIRQFEKVGLVWQLRSNQCICVHVHTSSWSPQNLDTIWITTEFIKIVGSSQRKDCRHCNFTFSEHLICGLGIICWLCILLTLEALSLG